MKAFAYYRVSSAGQVEGDGFTRQQAAVARAARNQGYEIKREFREEGVTGDSEWGERPAFQDMIAAILDNGVRTIFVENLTRLARAYTIQELILIHLASLNITLISADTGENITEALHGDPMKKALIQMQAVFSELEKNSLVRKLRAARQRKKEETGRCEGRKPFGHTDDEKLTIARMMQLRRSDFGYSRIASMLDAEGRKSRSGKPWTYQSVKNILNREV